MTSSAAHACLIQFRENTAMTVISRMMGVSKSSVYRMFFNHIKVKERFYHLKSVISIDEFKATTDKGTYAFHITDPINGKINLRFVFEISFLENKRRIFGKS